MPEIQFRRGLAATWTSVNPVLGSGEPGYETDTGQEKRGDGSTAWVSLPYVAKGAMQPLDADLTAIAALATTTFGRSLLTLASAAALNSAAEPAWTIVSALGTAHTFDQTVVRASGTLDQSACTITVTLTDNTTLDLDLVQGSGGGKTVTWSGVAVWATPTGAAPTLTTVSGGTDRVYFERINGVTYGYPGTFPPPTIASPTVSSGTVFTPSTVSNSMVTVQLAAGSAGSVTVTIGPSTGAENSIVNALAVASGAPPLLSVRVPANWKMVVTVTTVTIAQTRVVAW